jgi:hypothetical protein
MNYYYCILIIWYDISNFYCDLSTFFTHSFTDILEQNEGKEEPQYYMSQNLRKILDLKQNAKKSSHKSSGKRW